MRIQDATVGVLEPIMLPPVSLEGKSRERGDLSVIGWRRKSLRGCTNLSAISCNKLVYSEIWRGWWHNPDLCGPNVSFTFSLVQEQRRLVLVELEYIFIVSRISIRTTKSVVPMNSQDQLEMGLTLQICKKTSSKLSQCAFSLFSSPSNVAYSVWKGMKWIGCWSDRFLRVS